MKVTDNNIAILKAILATTPTIDSLKKKDAIITQKDMEIAIKVSEVVSRDSTISTLNANIAQLQ